MKKFILFLLNVVCASSNFLYSNYSNQLSDLLKVGKEEINYCVYSLSSQNNKQNIITMAVESNNIEKKIHNLDSSLLVKLLTINHIEYLKRYNDSIDVFYVNVNKYTIKQFFNICDIIKKGLRNDSIIIAGNIKTSKEMKDLIEQASYKGYKLLVNQNNVILTKISNLDSFSFFREVPKPYLIKAVQLFKKRQGKVIVELGSMRSPLNHDIYKQTCFYCIEGHSTMFWARTNAKVFSVDVDKTVSATTRKICKNYKNVNVVTMDGISFLRNFKRPIDLLFLDAWDLGTKFCAENHLKAYLAARPNLHNKSLILIDDTDTPDQGKGKLVIPRAVKDGYRIIFRGRQTLLAKI